MSAVATHEAAHAAVALAVGRTVESIERTLGTVLAGEQAGFACCPFEAIERSQLVVALSGYWATGRRGWPPDYEQAKTEELEALNSIIQALALDRQQYEELVEQTRFLLNDPHVRRLRDALGRALDQVPRVAEAEILLIAEAVGFPIPEHEEQLCNA